MQLLPVGGRLESRRGSPPSAGVSSSTRDTIRPLSSIRPSVTYTVPRFSAPSDAVTSSRPVFLGAAQQGEDERFLRGQPRNPGHRVVPMQSCLHFVRLCQAGLIGESSVNTLRRTAARQELQQEGQEDRRSACCSRASVARCPPSARRREWVPTIRHTSLILQHRTPAACFSLEIAPGSFRASSSHMNVDLPALEDLRSESSGARLRCIGNLDRGY